MKKAENMSSAGQILAESVFIGLVITLLLMMAGALLVNFQKVSGSVIPQIAYGTLALGAFLTALTAARKADRSKLLWGLAAGGILFVCLMLMSIAWFGEPVNLIKVLIVGGLVIVTSGVGGFAGASMKVKKRRKK